MAYSNDPDRPSVLESAIAAKESHRAQVIAEAQEHAREALRLREEAERISKSIERSCARLKKTRV